MVNNELTVQDVLDKLNAVVQEHPEVATWRIFIGFPSRGLDAFMHGDPVNEDRCYATFSGIDHILADGEPILLSADELVSYPLPLT